MEYIYEFGVYDITNEQAGDLLDAITAMVEAMGAHMGGGYAEATEATENEQGSIELRTQGRRNGQTRKAP